MSNRRFNPDYPRPDLMSASSHALRARAGGRRRASGRRGQRRALRNDVSVRLLQGVEGGQGWPLAERGGGHEVALGELNGTTLLVGRRREEIHHPAPALLVGRCQLVQ